MAYIEVEGLREFNKAIRQWKSKELNRELGQANKKIGQMVIDRLSPSPNPAAIGMGRGATVRASASKREVLLRVGGGHRAAGPFTNMQPWGAKRGTPVGQPTPKRPHIQGTAEMNLGEIEEAWMDAVMEAFHNALGGTS